MTIDVWFQKWDLFRNLIADGMFGHLGKQRWKRTDILMLMLTMSVYYQAVGKCQPFASAQWYAGNCFCNEKTVDRLVKWLKLQGFARVKRLRRRDTQALWERQNNKRWTNETWHEFPLYPDGFYSTNEIDLRPLLKELARLLGKILNQKVKQWRIYPGATGITFKGWEPSTDRPRWPVEEFLPLRGRA